MNGKGWIAVPGIREHADRTLKEQMLGLEPALVEAKGRTVLDLGCAEGVIGLEFAKAGATDVLGIELLAGHLAVARRVCDGFPMRFVQAHLGDYINENPDPERFDLVLALGIIHKLDDPAVPLRWACLSCKDLLLFRAPAKAWNGNVTSKHKKTVSCHVPTVMAEHGFAMERHIPGARGEGVEYWRRRR